MRPALSGSLASCFNVSNMSNDFEAVQPRRLPVVILCTMSTPSVRGDVLVMDNLNAHKAPGGGCLQAGRRASHLLLLGPSDEWFISINETRKRFGALSDISRMDERINAGRTRFRRCWHPRPRFAVSLRSATVKTGPSRYSHSALASKPSVTEGRLVKRCSSLCRRSIRARPHLPSVRPRTSLLFSELSRGRTTRLRARCAALRPANRRSGSFEPGHQFRRRLFEHLRPLRRGHGPVPNRPPATSCRTGFQLTPETNLTYRNIA